jgi:uncharacterized Zn finger protein (UPF0148 family)
MAKSSSAGLPGAHQRLQSLTGYQCPECGDGELRLKPDGTNVCDKCRFEVVTEWEWQRRQAANWQGKANGA